MPERESVSPPHDPDARLGDLFENLPEPTRQLPVVEDQTPAPGSRRAAREAARSEADPVPPTAATPPDAAPPAAVPASGGRLEDLFHGHDDGHDDAPPLPPAKKKRRTGCLVALLIVLALVGAVVAGGAWAWSTYGDRISDAMGWGAPDDWEEGVATGEALVTINTGDTGEHVSQALNAAGVTRTPGVFYDYLINENIAVTFYPGVYRLHESMTAEAALAALRNENNKLENSVMVPEGGTIESFLPEVADVLQLPLADLQAAVDDPSAYGVSARSLEGWLFPAAYQFDPGVTAPQVVQRMVDRTRESLANAGVPDSDAERVLTIASMIQREGRLDDISRVSRVIQNRLDIGMKLQMDSTAQYGVGELHAGSVSTSAEAQFAENDWNTYVIDGLPATPISTVSDAAIQAAQSPAEGPWLYFVTVNPESGETVFSVTYEEHQAAITQWADWCRANGNPVNGCAG